jgi:hypothetical protein
MIFRLSAPLVVKLKLCPFFRHAVFSAYGGQVLKYISGGLRPAKGEFSTRRQEKQIKNQNSGHSGASHPLRERQETL